MSIVHGKLTFDAEGNEGGPYHSRKLHVPSSTSGLTIGRGYDMKEKSSEKIAADLESAGVAPEAAATLSRAAGLHGDSARRFIEDNGLGDFEISSEAQEHLFKAVYAELEADVLRICHKSDCVEAYGAVDWDNLAPAVKDVLVDLRFRGDYASWSRKMIQADVSRNDVAAFTACLCDKARWPNVPDDRFKRRADYLRAAQGTAG